MQTSGPLTGVRVLELGQIAAGPFAGSLLADLGADVVKIENPSMGDGMRSWPPLSKNEAGEAYSENFASLNRNKRSVALDLKDEGDVAELKALCAAADILIENYRPGVLDRLGLGYNALKQVNPKLVMCSISGYGQTGPYATKGAFDVTVQAMSGLMSVTGEDDSGPVKCGVPVGDFCAGLYAAFAVTAAVLRARAPGGTGCHVDCSMLGCLIGVSALQTSEYFGTGTSAGRLGSAHPRNAPYQAFKASDDYFVIAAGTDKLWQQVCEAVGMPGLKDRPEFIDQASRAKNQKQLAQILEEKFQHDTAKNWLQEFETRGVPASPINTYADVFNDAHVQHMGIVKDLVLPNGVKTKTTNFPITLSGYELAIHRNPPSLGEHNQEVLKEWAVQKEELLKE
ncbi:CaiB/BaiF CoA transferase family protein [Eoetvoesiella caeni]